MKRWVLAITGFCIPFSGCLAQDEEALFFADLPIVASVSRLPQQMRDLPTSVTVLDRETIATSGARDINDLMRLVPGFQTFAHTTDPTRVTYHGLTDDDFSPRIQVLIDGRSMYSPLFRSGVNWNLLPVALEDIDRIEVVRGTNSASYGTNAFLGVINIVTVDPALVRGTLLSLNHGSQGVRDYTLRWGNRLGESGHLRLTYQQKDDQALTDRGDWSDAFRARLIDVRTDFQIGERDTVELRFGGAEAILPMGLVTGPDRTGYPYHPFEQSTAYFQADWRRVLSAQSDLALRYAYTRDQADDTFEGFSPAFGVYYTDSSFTGHSTRQEFEIQHTLTAGDSLRWVWGAGYRQDQVTSEALFYGNRTYGRRVTREFGNLEWKPNDHFTGNLGVSFDQDSLSGNSASPRIAANFHLNPDNTIRVAAARAVRSGAIADYRGEKRFEAAFDAARTPIPPGALFKYAYVADPNLPPERLHSIELGYLGEWRPWGMTLDVRAFREIIPNRILLSGRALAPLGLTDVLGAAATADVMTEAQRIRIQGVEYQWQWRPAPGSRLMLSQALIRIRASYLDRYVNDPDITSDYNTPGALARDQRLAEHSAPKLASSLFYLQDLPRNLKLSLAAYRQGPMQWTRNTTSVGFNRLDARLAYPFKWGASAAEWAVTTQALGGSYGEFKADGSANDRLVTRRTWLSFSLSL